MPRPQAAHAAKAAPKANPPRQSVSLITRFAAKFNVEPDRMTATLKQVAFRQRGKDGKQPPEISNEQLMALLIVSEQYGLNPWTREIYAFPDKFGGIVPVLGIDGWIRIINEHPQLRDIELKYPQVEADEMMQWFTVIIYRKDREKPIEVTEYLNECYRETDPWKQMPRRMLRHKALIQCARIAFGFAGLYDPDEAERIANAIDITPESVPPNKAQSTPPQQSQNSLPAPTNDEQLNLLRMAIDRTGVPENAVLKEFKVSSLDELKFDDGQAALEWIESNAP
jgi:phage recombination protein Bet